MADSDPKPSKYAHFENVAPTELRHLYERHAEVARDIHQNTLRRFTGNDTLTVDLVRESPVSPERETLDKMAQYEVMSASSELSHAGIIQSAGPADFGRAKMYRQYFADNEMPIFVGAAGNTAEYRVYDLPRVADFARTSLIVGEASYDETGKPYVESHSSVINPTLVSDSPFNRGEKYQYYNPSPSLEGYEHLITNWLVDREQIARADAFVQADPTMSRDAAMNKAAIEINQSNFINSEIVQAQVADFMASPEKLHALVMADIMKDGTVDAKGFATGIDGTSFSAPEQAGYISGAHYEQEQRAQSGKPALTKEEISSIAKMATIDVDRVEGSDAIIEQYNNSADFDFSTPAGHGMFQPEMFRKLLDEAYVRLDRDPRIDRQAVISNMSAPIDNEVGTSLLDLNSDLKPEQKIIVDRTRLDFEFSVHGQPFPEHVALVKSTEHSMEAKRFETGAGGNIFTGWVRYENGFGETLTPDQNWNAYFPNGETTMIRDMDVTIYGYNQGGLMDQLMDYAKTIEPDYPVGLDQKSDDQQYEIIMYSGWLKN